MHAAGEGCPASAIRSTGRSTLVPSESSRSRTTRGQRLARRAHALPARRGRGGVGGPLPVNVSLPIAAVMLDLGYPAGVVKAVPILARTAGLLAHLAEEREHPIGFLLAAEAEEAIEYRNG